MTVRMKNIFKSLTLAALFFVYAGVGTTAYAEAYEDSESTQLAENADFTAIMSAVSKDIKSIDMYVDSLNGSNKQTQQSEKQKLKNKIKNLEEKLVFLETKLSICFANKDGVAERK